MCIIHPDLRVSSMGRPQLEEITVNVLHPRTLQVVPNPEGPNVPVFLAK